MQIKYESGQFRALRCLCFPAQGSAVPQVKLEGMHPSCWVSGEGYGTAALSWCVWHPWVQDTSVHKSFPFPYQPWHSVGDHLHVILWPGGLEVAGWQINKLTEREVVVWGGPVLHWEGKSWGWSCVRIFTHVHAHVPQDCYPAEVWVCISTLCTGVDNPI